MGYLIHGTAFTAGTLLGMVRRLVDRGPSKPRTRRDERRRRKELIRNAQSHSRRHAA
ncbi:MAG TPA: hypothetical protein VER17_00240 [Tepidisphaeraceae bacterium]|nr:hypothetical protein [Tepidisphaeraceae bacterium]